MVKLFSPVEEPVTRPLYQFGGTCKLRPVRKLSTEMALPHRQIHCDTDPFAGVCTNSVVLIQRHYGLL